MAIPLMPNAEAAAVGRTIVDHMTFVLETNSQFESLATAADQAGALAALKSEIQAVLDLRIKTDTVLYGGAARVKIEIDAADVVGAKVDAEHAFDDAESAMTKGREVFRVAHMVSMRKVEDDVRAKCPDIVRSDDEDTKMWKSFVVALNEIEMNNVIGPILADYEARYPPTPPESPQAPPAPALRRVRRPLEPLRQSHRPPSRSLLPIPVHPFRPGPASPPQRRPGRSRSRLTVLLKPTCNSRGKDRTGKSIQPAGEGTPPTSF